ncbi:MAG TPA: hypothetical protein VFR68_10255 [Candidatus Dormibacteraeota bacterium]|nr:hypothetical protein [Candidatus Dormibacteraeota bacterium]
MKRLPPVLAVAALLLWLAQLTALAEDQPYRTVVDGILPPINGLNIQGTTGGCDLVVQNQTSQDVILLDLSKPAKPFRFAAQPKAATPRPPATVHLPAVGVWPCSTLPAVTEDERWNHAQVTVGSWTIAGAVGAVSFKLSARTVYDPGLDSSADLTFYLRVAAGALAVGGLLISGPYLFKRRREILGSGKRAA